MSKSAGGILLSATRQTWLRTKRFFYLDPTEQPGDSHGWYFKVRGPRCFGPYPSRQEADRVLNRMISDYIAANDTSGR